MRGLVWGLAAVLLLVACGPRVEGLSRDPLFGYGPAVQNGLLVAGVVAGQEGRETDIPAERNLLAEELRLALIDQAPMLSPVPAGYVARELGPDGYDALMDAFRYTGTPSREDLEALAAAFPRTRYAAFARVDVDQVGRNRDRAEQPVYAYDKKGKQKGDTPIAYETVETFSARREVAALVSVFDLAEARPVWSGRLRDTGYDSNQLTSVTPVTKDGGVNVSIGDIVVGNQGGGVATDLYPDPPSRQDVLRLVFHQAARAMLNE